MAKRVTEKQLQAQLIWATGQRLVETAGQHHEIKTGQVRMAAAVQGFDVSVGGPYGDGEMLFDIWADWFGGKKVFSMRWKSGEEDERVLVSFKRGSWEADFLKLAPLH